MRAIWIFAGPTISAAEGRRELDAVYRPPARQGDVYRAALERPLAIGLVDGYFETVPAVWHKEILWAMSRGVHVYGAASMGALRAAELHRFGMIGVGAVFEAFRDGRLEDDDEVAVTQAAENEGFRVLSEAMVDIRATLEAAEVAGIVARSTRLVLQAHAKALYYPDRSYPALLAAAPRLAIPEGDIARLRAWLPRGRIERKRQDALALLRRIQADRDGLLREPARPGFDFQHTVFWESLTRATPLAR
jgi:hypothetical protein